MSEVILKNSNLKKTELTYASSSIIYDSLKEFIYSKYKGDCLKTDIFGNIDNDFRAIAVIAAMDNENDEIIHKLNLKFIGVCGDLKNEKYIEKINLLDLIKNIENIENSDDFYITKFISDCM